MVKNDQKRISNDLLILLRSAFFVSLHAMKQEQRKMTQKEIVKMVLEKLGGRAHLTDICVLAKYYIGDSSQAKKIEANIRRELNTNHNLFCHIDGMPDGWWQLKSYKDEIEALKTQVSKQAEELEKYRATMSDEEFLDRYIDVVLEMGENVINAHELSLNRLNRVMCHRYERQIMRLTEKSKERVEHKSGDIILGDKVQKKTVIPSVGNYKPQIQTQSIDLSVPTTGQHNIKQLEGDQGRER